MSYSCCHCEKQFSHVLERDSHLSTHKGEKYQGQRSFASENKEAHVINQS